MRTLSHLPLQIENEDRTGQFFHALSWKTKRGRERGKRRTGGKKREKREGEKEGRNHFPHSHICIIETTNEHGLDTLITTQMKTYNHYLVLDFFRGASGCLWPSFKGYFSSKSSGSTVQFFHTLFPGPLRK
jgi:hypothetical protein